MRGAGGTGGRSKVQPLLSRVQSVGQKESRARGHGEKRQRVETPGAGGEGWGLMLHLPLSPALPTCGLGSAWNGECPGEKQRRQYPFPLTSE